MSFSASPAIVWFRDDQRLADNPALVRAAATGCPIVCVYVFEPDATDECALGAAARWYLHASLEALDATLSALGGRLAILRGPAAETLADFASRLDAGAIFWNRRYGALQRQTDAAAATALAARGITVDTHNGLLLNEPATILNGAGKPFQIFTAYWRACRRHGEPSPPLPAPTGLVFHPLPADLKTQTVDLADLRLQPHSPDWAGGLRAAWTGGEDAAGERLAAFLEHGFEGYARDRDRPDIAATSRLSPYLRFGNLSPRQVWYAAMTAASANTGAGRAADFEKFLAELGWREFSFYQLYHFPDLGRRSLRPRFDAMPWRTDPDALIAWQTGRTGYPLVDAGMRELWHTGWMHNRVRMITASFLVKHLLIDWRKGEAWFRDTLVDAEPASNAANWQWVAGSGLDAAPYFRIFNPVLQGTKFDPEGVYVKRWVPELAGLPAGVVHRPWRASEAQLAAAGVRMGDDYPLPIVEHEMARQRALGALKTMGME